MVTTEVGLMHRLLREGVPVAEVARRLGRSRQTLYNWLQRGEEGPSRRTRASKLDPHRAYLEDRLERFDLPAPVLLEELRKRGYRGGVSILRELVASIKDRHVRRLVDRFETSPGRQAQVDWASCGTIVQHGRRRRLSLLVVVLGYSRTIWARFVVSERRPVLIELLEHAFHELGGIPRELVFDNLKQVVARARSEEGPALVQPGFAAFAEHWGFEVVACPPYWPRAKGKVERAVGYIKRSFLEGRAFTTLEDLNAQLATWLAEVANRRLHGTTGERPVDRLAADRAGMLPPQAGRAFPSVQISHRLADHDAMISFDGVRYMVDPEILRGRRGELVEIHLGTDERLRIYHRGHPVGEYLMMPSGSPPQEDPAYVAARRRLRQTPPSTRPRGTTPRFDQHHPASGAPWGALAPVVVARPLSSYEVA
jgi:transposase